LRLVLFGAGRPDSLRSLGVAPVARFDAQDGAGGEAALAEESGRGVGIDGEEGAEEGQRFGAGCEEEGVEGGVHGNIVTRRRGRSSVVIRGA